MAFTIPVFPITCEIYTGPWLTKVLRLSGVDCNLAYGRRSQISLASAIIPADGDCQIPMTLLLPALTDIRDQASTGAGLGDLVEVPSGTGRWYSVYNVDDIGKGFANEHRAAVLFKLVEYFDPTHLAGSQWPTPIP